MKRNDDIIRQLLFEFEEQPNWQLFSQLLPAAPQEDQIKHSHLLLLVDEGWVTLVHKGGTYRLTAAGHDYLDVVRSDAVWEKTKVGVAQVGGMTLGMIKDLAIAYAKQAAAEKLGIEL